MSVVIVGAGLAGANAAIELRRLAPDAHVTLIGSEAHLPYQRPPLSKGFLRGSEQFEDALVVPRSEYKRLRIDLMLGRRVVRLEADEKRIRLDGDEVVPFDRALSGARYAHAPLEQDKLLSQIPLGRIGQPEDIADAVAFLASDWAAYISPASSS